MSVCFSSGLSSSFHQHTNKTAIEGDTVTLKCHNSTDRDDITWKKNNFVILREDLFQNRTMKNFTSERMFIERTAELKIKEIQAYDEGNYSCQNTRTQIQWILTVTGNSKISLTLLPILLCETWE